MGDQVADLFEDRRPGFPLRRFVLEAAPQSLKATVHAAFDAEPIGEVVPFENHGRWVVQCACKGAQIASRQWPVFVCCDCGAGPMTVVWDG